MSRPEGTLSSPGARPISSDRAARDVQPVGPPYSIRRWRGGWPRKNGLHRPRNPTRFLIPPSKRRTGISTAPPGLIGLIVLLILPGLNKCNLFVYETLNNSGKPVPMKERGLWGIIPREDHPPLAGQWADSCVEIPGWEVVTEPRPGDVAAIARDSSNASGHVGIVSGPNSTISATDKKVIESDWGFQPGQKPTFRRYVGP